MSKYITTTLSITSNAYSATNNPGPSSSPLAISVSDLLDVTAMESKIVDVTTTHQLLWDASDYFATNADTGIDGAYVYFRNLLAENTTADLLHDLVIHNTDATALAVDHAPRMFTLQPGEFAWVPWDLTNDIYADGQETNLASLECWLFIRTTTVNT